MFDVGFSELVLVFVIGLLILGPERLPRVAAQIGRWVGRARRTANQLRMQLEREIALEEVYRAQKPQTRSASKASEPPDDDGTVPSAEQGSDDADALEAAASSENSIEPPPGSQTDGAVDPAADRAAQPSSTQP